MVLPLYRNCFDTVSPLCEFSICLCQIYYFKPQSCQMLGFLWCAYVAGQSFFGISQLFIKSGSVTQKDVDALLPRSLNFAAELSWQSKTLYILVPNNCYKNQCFYIKKTKKQKT